MDILIIRKIRAFKYLFKKALINTLILSFCACVYIGGGKDLKSNTRILQLSEMYPASHVAYIKVVINSLPHMR